MIKIETKITEVSSEVLKNMDSLNNSMDTVNSVADGEFIVDAVEKYNWLLDPTQAGAFTKNLLDLISEVDLSNATMIQIQMHTHSTNPIDKALPKKFQITMNGNVIGKMSQFSMYHLSDILAGAFLIDSLEVLTEGNLMLSIWIGFNRA